MLPAVEQYQAAVKAAQEEYATQQRAKYVATTRESAGLQGEAYNEVWRVYYAAVDELGATFQAKTAAARETLKASDPFIGWMFDNANEDYPSHVQEVLKVWPMPVDEFKAWGKGLGWCNVFTDLLRQARAAGVLGDATDAPAEARDELVEYVSQHIGTVCCPDEFKRYVDAIVAAELAKVKAEQLARVDGVWTEVEAISPDTVSVTDAEFLFKRAVKSVLTGDKFAE